MKPAFAQFPAPPEGRKVLESRFGDVVTVTYKEVNENVCFMFGELIVHIEHSLRGQAGCEIIRRTWLPPSWNRRLGTRKRSPYQQCE
jgi:hypothetical protein